MAKAKTVENAGSVAAFINQVADEDRKQDCFELSEIFSKTSGFEPKMWGPAIIGFGSYHYKYDSGHEGDAPLVGFSPRKNEFALYIPNFEEKPEMLSRFGKHKTAKSCVYMKKLSDIDVSVLKKMILAGIKHYKAKYK